MLFKSGSLAVFTPQISTLLCIITVPAFRMDFARGQALCDSFGNKDARLTGIYSQNLKEKNVDRILQKRSFLVHYCKNKTNEKIIEE